MVRCAGQRSRRWRRWRSGPVLGLVAVRAGRSRGLGRGAGAGQGSSRVQCRSKSESGRSRPMARPGLGPVEVREGVARGPSRCLSRLGPVLSRSALDGVKLHVGAAAGTGRGRGRCGSGPVPLQVWIWGWSLSRSGSGLVPGQVPLQVPGVLPLKVLLEFWSGRAQARSRSGCRSRSGFFPGAVPLKV